MSKNWVIFGALGAAALGGYLVYRGSKDDGKGIKLEPAPVENVPAEQPVQSSNGTVDPVATDPMDILPTAGVAGMFGSVRIL